MFFRFGLTIDLIKQLVQVLSDRTDHISCNFWDSQVSIIIKVYKTWLSTYVNRWFDQLVQPGFKTTVFKYETNHFKRIFFFKYEFWMLCDHSLDPTSHMDFIIWFVNICKLDIRMLLKVSILNRTGPILLMWMEKWKVFTNHVILCIANQLYWKYKKLAMTWKMMDSHQNEVKDNWVEEWLIFKRLCWFVSLCRDTMMDAWASNLWMLGRYSN